MSLRVGTDSKASLPWITTQARRGRPVSFSKLAELPAEAARDKEEFERSGTDSSTVSPIVVDGKVLGMLSFKLNAERAFWPEPLGGRLKSVTQVLGVALARITSEEALARLHGEIKQLKEQLQAERDFLRADGKVSQGHGQIIGRSQSLRRVLHQVEQVAPTECPVLISGETGTGKELIAQEIHRLSARKERVMVLVNCAALPSALVESELFGRERGAYTGALTAQVGRFEIANGSTIFLDEVGELSMEVQAKLLRVLQAGEFQRLGSPKTHKVDVRIIAATNRDLAGEVRKGRFREDLYYRLKVFPVDIPPLRERVADIPLLAFAFMEEFSGRMGKKITKMPRKAMEALQRHTWPGNIRELRNVIEHSVIVSSGEMLKLSSLGDSPTRDSQVVTLAEAEREHILKTLETTSWRIKGPHGAAQRLDLQPSTLYSRMQKLGIPHRRQKDEMATQG
jgi:transcriptional regulator with GAF, ATPase, and Fis domain